MKKTQFATDFSVGFVLFVATLVVIASLFLVGDGQSFFADHAEYRVAFPNAEGLKPGSTVWLAGVLAGTVRRIDFPEDLSSNEVIATLQIDKSYHERIREDSRAWLQTQGLLGDIAIHVKLGTAGQPMLPPGAQIPFTDRPMLDAIAGKEFREGTTDLLKMMVSVLSDINKGEGSLGKLLKDPQLYDNLTLFSGSMAATTKQLQSITGELDTILVEIRSQKGTLGKLIFSEEYARNFSTAISEASLLIGQLREVTDMVRSGKGSAGKLIVESTLHDTLEKSLGDLSRVASRVDDLLRKAEGSGSVLGRLATDGGMGRGLEGLVARLERSAGSLEKILSLVERGEGSVGMLVHDPSIAASLRDVFLGVADSGLVHGLVRSAERSGREAYLRDLNLAKREAEEVLRARALARVRGETGDNGKSGPASERGKPVPAAGPEEPGDGTK